jgi:hypothetical protein
LIIVSDETQSLQLQHKVLYCNTKSCLKHLRKRQSMFHE